MIRYRWVLDRKAEGFPITMACKVAEVSRQAFYDWRAKRAAGPSNAEVADAVLVAEMREVQAEFDDTYGQPRMTPELRERVLREPQTSRTPDATAQHCWCAQAGQGAHHDPC